MNRDTRPTIVFDFDGVIHRYSKGWCDGSIYDIPTKSIKELLDELRSRYKIVIISTRCNNEKSKNEMIWWLHNNKISYDEISAEKVPAIAYVDDRAICFKGDCVKLKEEIINFKPWQQSNITEDEIDAVKEFIRLGIRESSYEDINKYSYLEDKVVDILCKSL